MNTEAKEKTIRNINKNFKKVECFLKVKDVSKTEIAKSNFFVKKEI